MVLKRLTICLLLTCSLFAQDRGRERYHDLGRHSSMGDYRDGVSNVQKIRFEATLSGYINLAIAHEGTCDVYADGTLLGSVDPLGAELVTNGDFTNWTGDVPDSWTVVEAGDGQISESPSGQLNITSSGNTNTRLYQDVGIAADLLYQISHTATATAGNLLVMPTPQTEVYVNIDATGSYTTYVRGDNLGNSYVAIRDATSGAVNGSVNSFSVKQISETSLYVTAGQTVDIVFSNPETVTLIDMTGARLKGDFSQFGQFTNLAELTTPNMDPVGYITDTELVTDNAFPADLSNWTEVETGGTVSVSGGVITVARTDNTTSVGQDILTQGSVYTATIHVTTTSGTVQIQDNDGTNILSITEAGTHTVEFFSQAASGELNVVAVSNGASVSFDILEVKAITSSVINGGLAAWTGTTPDNWTKVEEGAGLITESPAGSANLASAGNTNTRLYQDLGLAASAPYRSLATVTVTSGYLLMMPTSQDQTYDTLDSTGTHLSYWLASADNSFVALRDTVGGATDVSVDSLLIISWPIQNIGSINQLPLATMTDLTMADISNVAWVDGAFDNALNLNTVYVEALNWTQTEVNNFWVSLDTGRVAGSDISYITVIDMLASTGAGATAQSNLAGAGVTIVAP